VQQAQQTADRIDATSTPVAVWSSPLRRARQTAAPIAGRLGVPVGIDDRLRERMNWEGAGRQTWDAFLDDWKRASADRTYVPAVGDSSVAAGQRFLEALTELTAGHGDATVVVVTHGGVTVDLVRTLLGDGAVNAGWPGLVDHGVPSCGLTRLVFDGGEWTVRSVGTIDHLD
jgi:broad specificity phosphatase PhoE